VAHATLASQDDPVNLVKIGIMGDFDREKRSHWATEAALFHAAARLRIEVEPHWISTQAMERSEPAEVLGGFDGLFGAPGSPFESFQGMLKGIAFARENDVPYLGTCAGFQYALIEFSRNVLGVTDADTAENNSATENVVITPVECPVPNRRYGSPRLSGEDLIHPIANTMLGQLIGRSPLREEYFCNFETNADFVSRWEAAGLRVSARGPQGEMRAFELPAKRFFVATLFQPQLSSSMEQPHPIVIGYLRAAVSA
jgi:CTP synthase (UTP-ammonia lyase)